MLKDSSYLETSVFFCKTCNSFSRDCAEEEIESHLFTGSYTNPVRDSWFYNQRKNYFPYLYKLVSNPKPSSWLDFGCAYGHMIDFLSSSGIAVDGVEINERMLFYCQQKKLNVFQYLHEIPEDKKYDVISVIDSIYYLTKPKEVVGELYKRLNKGGILIIRITNRNWLAKFRSPFEKNPSKVLGDVTISYSYKSLKRLLQECNFQKVDFIYEEKGKWIKPFSKKAFYGISTFLAKATFNFIKITPGVIAIAKK
jgi:SAM-dependent methyltransferase